MRAVLPIASFVAGALVGALLGRLAPCPVGRLLVWRWRHEFGPQRIDTRKVYQILQRRRAAVEGPYRRRPA